jgi:hypothetical protein
MIIAPLPFYIPAFTGSTKRSPSQNQSIHPKTAPTISPTDGLKTAAANQEKLRQLANHLRGISLLWNDSTSAQTISSALSTWNMPIDPDSSYPHEGLNNPSLAEVISQLGFDTPTTRTQTIALRDALDQKASAPSVGNTGGGLSWPLPLDATQQQQIVDTLDRNSERLSGLPLADKRKGTLGYLLEATPLIGADLQDPHETLEKLLKSPRAEALGQAIQAKLSGISTHDSLYEYVLSAIHLGLDRESISQPGRTTVAGFDWAQEQYQGKPASTVLDGLKAHLVATGKTTPATAAFAAQLLLGRVAPEFLVKDIPDRVVYGSQAWATFCIAVAKVEQEAPGVTAKMTFAEVMQRADAITDPAPAHAQQAALIDWGLANGLLAKSADEAYSPEQLESVRAAFNDQQDQRLEASASINADIPTRKDVALKKLKAHFPDLDPTLFDKPLLQLDESHKQGAQALYDPNRRPVGLYFSMLDIFMGDSTLGKWKSSDPRIPVDRINTSPPLGVMQALNTEFDAAIEARKRGIATTVRHLISQLPLEDRKKLESGKIQFFHESTYESGALKSKNLMLSFKVEQGGQRSIYQLDIQNLSIRRKDNYVDLKEVTWPDGNVETRQTEFKPKNGGNGDQGERPSPERLDSFSSARSHLIAEAFVEHLEYDNPAIKQGSMGATPHEKQQQAQVDAGEFFLNLIPFRSAIVNFSQGNYAEGALDLGLDIFSFVTAGAGTAAKLGKLGSKAVSAGAKFIKGAKVIGVAAIGALNPLDGVGDLLMGAAKLTGKAGRQLFKGLQTVGAAGVALTDKSISTLKGATGSYDLIKASEAHGMASIGTFKSADQTVETVAVHHNDQWYAYDPVKNQPYGGPIKDFTPAYTLGPRSPDINIVPMRHNRVAPYNVHHRPPRARAPLPQGEYATAMKGKLEPDHFKPDTKFDTVKKFVEELFDHYAKLPGNLPPRPVIPKVIKPVPAAQMLEDVLKTSDGVVLGELHNQMASFKLLFDNIETLKKEGVKRVYLEGLLSRPDLPKGYQDDGIGMLGDTGKPRTAPSFEDLKTALEANGIEVIPLDHYYLTRHKDVKHLYGATKPGQGSEQRLREFNYYASKTIESTSNGEKWVAVVGTAHMKTSEGVPGVAEMTGSTAIGVFDHKTPTPSLGYAAKVPAPDPLKPLRSTDYPGDLRIFV